MTQNENKHTDQPGLLKFDPIVLVRDIAKRWALVILAVLVVGMAAHIYKTATYKPVYRTSLTYVTYTRSSTATVFNNLSSANMVASVFEELLNSSLLRETILRESGLHYLDGTISAKLIPDTNLLTVTVSGSDPRSVFLLAKAIVEYHETVTYQVIDGVSLELLQAPSVPMTPGNPPNTAAFVKKAALLAAVAVIVLLGALSFCRDTVRSSQEVKSKLDCDFIGEIPHERRYKTVQSWLLRRRSSVLVTNPLSSFLFVEAFQKLASRVEYNLHGKKVAMVTSLLETEGKTTVTVNLAMSLAAKHEKVLLIDCDLRKPACKKLTKQRTVAHGLRDVLDGKVDVLSALVQDKRSGLYMLLENNATQESDDYLSGENMRALLDWARKNFSLVVLDLPPIGPVSDAESVMELADASVLVVRQNVAKAAGINRAIARLESGKAKLLGCVLNDVYRSGLLTEGYSNGYNPGYRKYDHYGHYGKTDWNQNNA